MPTVDSDTARCLQYLMQALLWVNRDASERILAAVVASMGRLRLAPHLPAWAGICLEAHKKTATEARKSCLSARHAILLVAYRMLCMLCNADPADNGCAHWVFASVACAIAICAPSQQSKLFL